MHKSKFFKILVGLCLISISVIAGAKDKDINVTVTLKKIEALKTSEQGGDEVYFSISEYHATKEPHLTRVPMFPLYWKSKDLPSVHDIVLWSGTIKMDQGALVVLTLMEQDLPPFNPDDLIGSMQVKFVNKKGKLITQWGIPTYSDQPKIEQPNPKEPYFVLYGDDSKYDVSFVVNSK